MNDQEKTKEQLIQELQNLRQQTAKLYKSESQRRQEEAEIECRLQEMTLLSQVTTATASATDIANALENVCAELARFLQVPQAGFAILNPERTAAELIADYHPPDRPSGVGIVLPVAENPSMVYVLKHKAPLAIVDAQTDPLLAPIHEVMRQRNTQSLLIVPIVVDGEVIGTIGFDAFQRRVFSDSEIDFVQYIAGQTGQILSRKLAEDALRESEEKYRALVNTSVDGIISVDPQMKIVLWNKGAEEIFGYTEEEILGQPLTKIVPEEYVRAREEEFVRFRESGPGPIIVRTLELECLGKDGTEIPVELSISSRKVGDTYIATAIARDVTERKQADAEHEQLLTAFERRSTQLQTAAEVSRAVSSILDPEALAPQVVDLVRERFGLYYAGLFLVDQTGEWTGEPHKWAVLRAGTGEAGRQMLNQSHKLEIGGTSMIGWCIARKQARISLDVGDDAVRFDNPLLPKTRSELALPLINRGRPIGALTIQSNQESAFSQEDIAALQTMADQMANAIANARLFNQAQREINERKQAEAMLTSRLGYEESLAACSRTLLADTPEAITDALRHLLTGSEVSRVYIFENFGDPLDGLCMRQIHEVCGPGVTPEIGNPDLQHLPYKEGFGRWQEELSKGNPIAGLMESFPQPEKEILESQDILSILVLPIRVEKKWYGFVGFDDTAQYRKWDKENIRLLQTAAGMIGAYIERKQAAEALRGAHADLAQYTDNLERRTAQLQVGAEVAREAASILDVQQLLDTTVRLVSERFGFYHAGVFLVDEPGEYAVLRAASSAGGQRMLERGHKLQIGKVGIVGNVAATGNPRIALDVGQDAVHFVNPDLPDTHSEMGLPLKVRGRTIGVLDVQDTQEAAFSDDDVAVLQTLADQLAVAIDNARLLERTETQLRELGLLYGEYSASTWAELTSPERSLGYIYDRIDVRQADKLPATSAPALDMALARGETITLVEPEMTERMLATPLKLHDQIIGTIGIQEANAGRVWSPNEIALVEAVSDQVALALENAQHFAETQKFAQQMQVLNELAQALATRLNIEAVLAETYLGTSRLLDTTNFYIGLYDPEKNVITFPFHVTESATDEQITSIPADQGLAGYIVQNRTSVLLKENALEQMEEMGITPVGQTALSWLGVPLFSGEQVLGVMAVQSYTIPNAYDERDRDLLTAVASQTTIALQNANLFEQIQTTLSETENLYRASRAIVVADTPDDVLRAFTDHVVAPQMGRCVMALIDFTTSPDDPTVEIEAAWEPGVERPEVIGNRWDVSQIPAMSRMITETLTEPLIIPDVANTPGIDQVSRHVLLNVLGIQATAIIPLLAGERTLGWLLVESLEEPYDFSEQEMRLYRTLAGQAAVTLESMRLFEETQRRAVHLQAASEVARDATAILEVDHLLNETVQLISEQFDFYHAGVFLLDDQNKYAVLRAASSEGGQRMLKRGHKLQVGKVGIVGNVAATGDPHIALDVGQDAVHFVNPDLPDTHSEMGLPLKVREQVIGVLDVQSTQEAAFSNEDISVLQTLADQLAAAIANARLFQEVRTDAMRRALINEVQQAAAASLNPDELLHQAGEVISRRLERPSAAFSWEPEGQSLRPVAIHDSDGNDVLLADELRVIRQTDPTLFSEVIDERRICVLEPITKHLGSPAATLTGPVETQKSIYVPLTARDQVLGVLTLAQPEDAPHEDMDFIEIIGANLSVALESAHLYQEALETTERLQEMDRLKSQFLANMSHELRTPLNSIIGFSRVILKGIDGPLTDMQRTDLEAVYNSGQHLLGLINGILDISKIQAGKMDLSFEDVKLDEVVKVVMSTAIALVKEKNIELQQAVPPDLPTMRADPGRLRQVLLNLIGNSAKFTDDGFIRVEAKSTPTEMIIKVIDSGTGIPQDKLETIFEEFTQVDGSSTRAVGGTGLGLAITRHFVEMHGGRIWAESVLGVGSTFYIALPIAGPPDPFEEEEEMEVEQPEPEPEPELEPDQRVVLCVDDDEGVITLFRRYLGKQGYQIVGLTNSAAVLDKARQLKPFAITLDVMMPGKDGWQVIQELKADPDTCDIPVIMCSIVSEKEYGISLGASDYLLKPILEDDLVAALERLDKEDRHRVLIVDDHPGDRNLIRRMIEGQDGYEVVEATGGQEAITLVQQMHPNIIVLDLMMPEVDGFAVLESIKADKITRSIPIVVVTAKELTKEERAILNKGVESLLHKGLFEQQELLADVAAALKRITTT